jgi:CRISPR-associated protein Cst1
MMNSLPFRFVGHPFVDVGVATLCAAAKVDDPSKLTREGVDEFAQELIDIYLSPAMSGFLGYVVFANARFANPAQLKPAFDAERREKLIDVMQLWRPEAPPSKYEKAALPGETCIFSGDPAVVRLSRMYIPLTTDESNINFVPEGTPLLAVSGWCLMALLAMPMGGLASQGKMWIVHSFDPITTIHFAAANLARNRRDFQMQGLSKRPNYKFARTATMRDFEASLYNDSGRSYYSLTTYLFTSSGQKSEVTINHLTSPVLRFIRRAQRKESQAWTRIIQRAEWRNAEPENKDGAITYMMRNTFYEELFDLPANAHSFLKRYLLRTPLKGKPSGEAKNDPRFTYSMIDEGDLVSWTLTDLFLTEVMEMEAERIEIIRVIGDRIAEYIAKDERLFGRLFYAKSGDHFRTALIKADRDAVKIGMEPLFKYDEYILAFFTDRDKAMTRFDWYLARDLLMVRVIEQMYQRGRMDIVKNAADEDAAEDDAE